MGQKQSGTFPQINGLNPVQYIGQSGIFSFYQYVNPSDGTQVTIKTCPPDMGSEGDWNLQNEARIAGGLPPVTGYSRLLGTGNTVAGRPFLVYQNNGDVSLMAAAGQWPLDSSFSGIGQLASSVETLHQMGLVNRIITPGSVLVSSAGILSLADFSCTEVMGASQPVPAFMQPWIAPELRLNSDSADALIPASPVHDVWGLALTTFMVLEGRMPYQIERADNSSQAIMQRIDQGIGIEFDRVELSDSLRNLLHSALSADPTQRPQTVAEFAGALFNPVMVEPVPAAVDEAADSDTVSESADEVVGDNGDEAVDEVAGEAVDEAVDDEVLTVDAGLEVPAGAAAAVPAGPVIADLATDLPTDMPDDLRELFEEKGAEKNRSKETTLEMLQAVLTAVSSQNSEEEDDAPAVEVEESETVKIPATSPVKVVITPDPPAEEVAPPAEEVESSSEGKLTVPPPPPSSPTAIKIPPKRSEVQQQSTASETLGEQTRIPATPTGSVPVTESAVEVSEVEKILPPVVNIPDQADSPTVSPAAPTSTPHGGTSGSAKLEKMVRGGQPVRIPDKPKKFGPITSAIPIFRANKTVPETPEPETLEPETPEQPMAEQVIASQPEVDLPVNAESTFSRSTEQVADPQQIVEAEQLQQENLDSAEEAAHNPWLVQAASAPSVSAPEKMVPPENEAAIFGAATPPQSQMMTPGQAMSLNLGGHPDWSGQPGQPDWSGQPGLSGKPGLPGQPSQSGPPGQQTGQPMISRWGDTPSPGQQQSFSVGGQSEFQSASPYGNAGLETNPPKKNRKLQFVGLGALILVLVVVIASFVFGAKSGTDAAESENLTDPNVNDLRIPNPVSELNGQVKDDGVFWDWSHESEGAGDVVFHYTLTVGDKQEFGSTQSANVATDKIPGINCLEVTAVVGNGRQSELAKECVQVE